MSFNDIPAGKDIPNDIYVAIEIPANSTPVKYEIEKEYDAVFVDRFMATPMFYPANYGYVPNTLSDDGDPLDVLVVTPYPVQPGSIVRARPIGILDMSDEGGGTRKCLRYRTTSSPRSINMSKSHRSWAHCSLTRSSIFLRTTKTLKRASGSRSMAGADPTQHGMLWLHRSKLPRSNHP